jgi:Flp pilus assembly protein TadD
MVRLSSNSGSIFDRNSGFFPGIIRFAVLLAGLAMIGNPVPARARPRDPDPPEIRLALARIDSLLEVGALPAALVQARALHGEHADNPILGWQVESRLGVALLRSGDPAGALPSLENAIRKAPGQSQNHRNLGAALVALGRGGRALSEYAQAVELDPLDFELRLEYGQLLLDFRDHSGSREQLLTAEHLCGGCPEIQEPLARMYLATGEFSSAVPLLRELYGRQPLPGVRRSLIQAMQGAQLDSVLLDFLAAGPLPDLPADEALLLVDLEGRLERPVISEAFALALSESEKESALVPASVRKSGNFWGRVSYNLLLVEKNRPALTALNRAIALEPENIVFLNNRVVLLTRLGLHEEAAAQWRKVIELDPTIEERNKQ